MNVFVEDAENSVDAGTAGRDDPLHLPVKPEAIVNIGIMGAASFSPTTPFPNVPLPTQISRANHGKIVPVPLSRHSS